MLQLDDLIDAYLVARKNKRRSADQVEFELHWESRLWLLYQNIVSRSVQPTAYTFIVEHPKPREVFASDMETRILHHYLDIRLRPIFERQLSPHTFNNRVGMGQNAIQNAVISDTYEISKGYTQDAWVVKIDLKGCFPNIRQDIAYSQLESLILDHYKGEDTDELLYMLQLCIYSYPAQHCYRKSELAKWSLIPKEKSLFHKPPGVGAAIGHLIWQNAVNYYFHEIDEWAMENGIRMERFVDDMYFVTSNKEMFSCPDSCHSQDARRTWRICQRKEVLLSALVKGSRVCWRSYQARPCAAQSPYIPQRHQKDTRIEPKHKARPR